MSFEFDPFDEKYWENPYPYYTEMRHKHPVCRRDNANPRIWPDLWMITRSTERQRCPLRLEDLLLGDGTLIDTDASLLPETMFHTTTAFSTQRNNSPRGTSRRILAPATFAPHLRH